MTHYTLKELADKTGSKLVGSPDHIIYKLASLDQADSSSLSFFSNPRYQEDFEKSKAGAVFVSPHAILPEGRFFLVHDNPSAAFQIAIGLFIGTTEPFGFKGIHPTAYIHPTAKLGEGVTIGPFSVIDSDVIIGDKTIIGSHVSIGMNVKIGQSCLFYSHVTIREHCKIGNRVIIQPGAVIGSCGFGYITNKKGEHEKLEQVGSVILEDDVEIGANTTIDRARFETTTIGQGSKIDNLVQIGHGVVIGPYNIIVAQTGIAGSTETGSHVVIGGQAAINGHIKIAPRVMLAARSGVAKSITESGTYGGTPAKPIKDSHKQMILVGQLERHIKRIESLEKQLQELQQDRQSQ